MEHDVAMTSAIKSILKELILEVDSELYHGRSVSIEDLTNEFGTKVLDVVFPDSDTDMDDILEASEEAIRHARHVEFSSDLERIIWEETWVTMELQGSHGEMPPCETPSSYDFVQERTSRTMDRVKAAQRRGHGFADI